MSCKKDKYNTTILLLQNKRAVPDTMLNFFAGTDEYRYELYLDLKRLKQLNLFPAAQKNQQAIARSEILYSQSYNKPDTLVFMEKFPVDYKDRSGYVYVFKYKEKKEDNTWKLATVGLLPKDESLYEFPETKKKPGRRFDYYYNNDYDFTNISETKLTTETAEKEHLQKLIKKLVYGKRKSAAHFYIDGERYGDMDFSRMKF